MTHTQFRTMVDLYRTTTWFNAPVVFSQNQRLVQPPEALRKWATVLIGDGC